LNGTDRSCAETTPLLHAALFSFTPGFAQRDKLTP
jgi:hypothetical protein